MANKMRSILTMLGIIIGVGSVIAMVGIATGATANIMSQIESLGSNMLIVMPGAATTGGVRQAAGSMNSLTMSDMEKLESAAAASGSAIKTMAPVSSVGVQAVNAAGNTQTTMTGTTPAYAEVRNITVEVGRFITEEDINEGSRVAVIGPSVVENLTGSSQTNMIGQTIKFNNVPFMVIGITESKGSSGMTNNDDIVIVPISTAQIRMIGNKYVRSVFIEATSPDTMTAAQEEITSVLMKAHKIGAEGTADFTITNQADVLSTIQTVTRTMTMMLGGIAGISLLVGGIGIMNIMLVSVTERTREIGIRKAIGAKRKDILLQFLVEAVVLCVIGGGVGILFGVGSATLLGKALDMATKVSLAAIVIAVAFSAFIGIVFGVFPAKKAADLDPIDALRYE
jgi:putative ABC transport system permease protein